MARRRGRSVGDVSRYTATGTRTAPTFSGDQTDDDSITSGTTFVLVAVVVFVLLCFAAVRFGTQSIESDIEANAAQALAASGFTDVEVEANGTTVSISGSFLEGQNEADAYRAVEGVRGVGAVEGQIWMVSTGELDAVVIRGAGLEATWVNGAVVVSGNLSTEDKITFVGATLTDSETTPFTTVDVEGLTVKEGLPDENWLGPVLGLLQRSAQALPVGLLKADGDNKLVAVAAETEDKDLQKTVNDDISETALALGFSPTPGVLLLDTGPTEEEVEELQEDLNELVLDQVVEFEIKSFELTAKGQALLDEVLAALRAAPDGIRVVIGGHTDDRGSDAENQLLSEQRAEAVLAYLVARGQDPERFETIGYGESLPVESNATADGRARNRRIEFTALFDDVNTEEEG